MYHHENFMPISFTVVEVTGQKKTAKLVPCVTNVWWVSGVQQTQHRPQNWTIFYFSYTIHQQNEQMSEWGS